MVDCWLKAFISSWYNGHLQRAVYPLAIVLSALSLAPYRLLLRSENLALQSLLKKICSACRVCLLWVRLMHQKQIPVASVPLYRFITGNTLLSFVCMCRKNATRKIWRSPSVFLQFWLLHGHSKDKIYLLCNFYGAHMTPTGLNVSQRDTIGKMICSLGRLTVLFMQCFYEKGASFLCCTTVNDHHVTENKQMLMELGIGFVPLLLHNLENTQHWNAGML